MQFARENHLNLPGLSFASDGPSLLQGHGYYYASKGSGQLLLASLDRLLPKTSPLLLYGFSGGAQFTSRFAEWKPERVLGWCAYSAGLWDKPVARKSAPPRLVICGENDSRYGASLIYFKQGRALDKPWLWVGIADTNHSISPQAEDFVRHYFASILEGQRKDRGKWVDIDSNVQATDEVLLSQPSLTGWLPDARLLTE